MWLLRVVWGFGGDEVKLVGSVWVMWGELEILLTFFFGLTLTDGVG